MVTSHVIARLEFNWKIFNSGAAFCEKAATATDIAANLGHRTARERQARAEDTYLVHESNRIL